MCEPVGEVVVEGVQLLQPGLQAGHEIGQLVELLNAQKLQPLLAIGGEVDRHVGERLLAFLRGHDDDVGRLHALRGLGRGVLGVSGCGGDCGKRGAGRKAGLEGHERRSPDVSRVFPPFAGDHRRGREPDSAER